MQERTALHTVFQDLTNSACINVTAMLAYAKTEALRWETNFQHYTPFKRHSRLFCC